MANLDDIQGGGKRLLAFRSLMMLVPVWDMRSWCSPKDAGRWLVASARTGIAPTPIRIPRIFFLTTGSKRLADLSAADHLRSVGLNTQIASISVNGGRGRQ
jgi:hypothetical protein